MEQQQNEQVDYSAFRPLILWGIILITIIIFCVVLILTGILNIVPAMVVIGGSIVFIALVLFGPRKNEGNNY